MVDHDAKGQNGLSDVDGQVSISSDCRQPRKSEERRSRRERDKAQVSAVREAETKVLSKSTWSQAEEENAERMHNENESAEKMHGKSVTVVTAAAALEGGKKVRLLLEAQRRRGVRAKLRVSCGMRQTQL